MKGHKINEFKKFKVDLIKGHEDTIIEVNEVMCERDCFWFEAKYE